MTDAMPPRLRVIEQIVTCTACPLHEKVRAPVPLFGPVPADILVLGEAPGREEDLQGQPFIGPAGQLLRESLTQAGFDPAALTYANTVCCNPGGPPSMASVNACSSNLAGQLELVDPRWILLVGSVALGTLRKDLKISRAQRHAFAPTYTDPPFYFAAIHPSWAMRNGRRGEQVLVEDLTAFAAVMADWSKANTDCVICGCTEEDMAEHGMQIRWDSMAASYCGDCWSVSPEMRAEAKQGRRIERHQGTSKAGTLFPDNVGSAT